MSLLAHRARGGFAATALLVVGALSGGSGCVQANNCPKDGVWKCDKGMLSQCEQGDFGPLTWHESGTCAANPACAASTSSFSYCAGDDLVSCLGGFRTGSAPCGSAGAPGGPASTRCVQGLNACVPPESMPDPACNSGEACPDGTTLVYCVGGLAVSRTACLTCANFNPCRGFLGDTCDVDGDCASGLACHADARGVTRCTAACDPAGAAPPGGPANASQSCLDLFRDGGPPLSSYLRVLVPGTFLVCVAGYCEWSS